MCTLRSNEIDSSLSENVHSAVNSCLSVPPSSLTCVFEEDEKEQNEDTVSKSIGFVNSLAGAGGLHSVEPPLSIAENQCKRDFNPSACVSLFGVLEKTELS